MRLYRLTDILKFCNALHAGPSSLLDPVDEGNSIVVNDSKAFTARWIVLKRPHRKNAKSEYWLRQVRPSVFPSAWNNSTPIGRIFIKFGI